MSAIADEMHRAFIEATHLVASALPDAASAEVGEWFVYEAGVENPDFNLAAVAGDPGRAALELEAVADWFAERRAGYRLKLRAVADRPVIAAAGPAVDERGRREPYLSLDLRRRAGAGDEPCGLRVERATNDTAFAAYDQFDAEQGRPPEWSIAKAVAAVKGCALVLGWIGDEPVARAMAVAVGPVGSIHNVVVSEAHRRRGFGRTITEAAIAECERAGARAVSLGSSTMGLPLYRSMGFVRRYELATFVPRTDAAGPANRTGATGGRG